MSNEKLREALRRIKYEAVSLADAQVIALEALTATQQAAPTQGAGELDEVARIISVSSAIIGNLPELPGYNGSVLTIDDDEARRISADLDRAYNIINEQS